MSSPAQLPAIRREADFTAEEKKLARKSVAGSAIGNAIEWFDYGIYGYLIVYISELFFTFGEDAGALPRILAFSTFAISFIVRPLGGTVLGLGAVGGLGLATAVGGREQRLRLLLRVGRFGLVAYIAYLLAYGAGLLPDDFNGWGAIAFAMLGGLLGLVIPERRSDRIP